MTILFKNARSLIDGIDEFLNAISEAAIVFPAGLKNYLENEEGLFQQRLTVLKELESKADAIRRRVENDLYRNSLIPQHRGDVLGLLENLDDVIDQLKETLFHFEVERPLLPAELHKSYSELANIACDAVENIVKSTRVFFIDPENVKDHLHKVYFYEKEADKLSLELKRKIFMNPGLDLSQKAHLRYFASHIDGIADKAESVADMLSIYAIKQRE